MEHREILIIDDEDSIHKILGDYLGDRGFRVFSAFNGHDGLELLNERPTVQTVLTDIRVPGMDGLEILRCIKERDPLTQVILMTAYSNKTLAIQALRAGADDYLEKPFQMVDLNAVLERCEDRLRMERLSRRWNLFLEHLPVGLIRCAADGGVLGITPAAADMLAAKPDQLCGRILWKIAGLQAAAGLFTTAAAASLETEIAGRAIVLQAVEAPADDSGTAFVLVLTDITEEKQLHHEIAQLSRELDAKVAERTRSLTSELEFSSRLLDAAGVLIAVLDDSGKLARMNKFARDLTRFTPEEAERVFSSFVRHPESPLSKVFDPLSAEELTGLICDLPTRDGTRRILSWSTRNLPPRGGVGGRIIIGIDVTEEKLLESKLKSYTVQLQHMVESSSLELREKNAQLIHTARLASLGEIAAGIAHEMKQPLNVISITADLIRLLHRNGTLSDDLLLSNLDKIRSTVGRMAATLNHLRGFTHIDSANFESVFLPDAVDGALSILGAQIRLDGIDIIRRDAPDIPGVRGELHQIEQVLVNLLQNARHAIEERAQSEQEQGDSPANVPQQIFITTAARQTGKQAVIEITDTGIGIPADLQQRVFEPFFTTKAVDRGTGLGLSISLNIVQSHGGSIEMESAPGRGSTFRVVFPAETALDV